jgi:hypothetical protein
MKWKLSDAQDKTTGNRKRGIGVKQTCPVQGGRRYPNVYSMSALVNNLAYFKHVLAHENGVRGQRLTNAGDSLGEGHACTSTDGGKDHDLEEDIPSKSREKET